MINAAESSEIDARVADLSSFSHELDSVSLADNTLDTDGVSDASRLTKLAESASAEADAEGLEITTATAANMDSKTLDALPVVEKRHDGSAKSELSELGLNSKSSESTDWEAQAEEELNKVSQRVNQLEQDPLEMESKPEHSLLEHSKSVEHKNLDTSAMESDASESQTASESRTNGKQVRFKLNIKSLHADAQKRLEEIANASESNRAKLMKAASLQSLMLKESIPKHEESNDKPTALNDAVKPSKPSSEMSAAVIEKSKIAVEHEHENLHEAEKKTMTDTEKSDAEKDHIQYDSSSTKEKPFEEAYADTMRDLLQKTLKRHLKRSDEAAAAKIRAAENKARTFVTESHARSQSLVQQIIKKAQDLEAKQIRLSKKKDEEIHRLKSVVTKIGEERVQQVSELEKMRTALETVEKAATAEKKRLQADRSPLEKTFTSESAKLELLARKRESNLQKKIREKTEQLRRERDRLVAARDKLEIKVAKRLQSSQQELEKLANSKKMLLMKEKEGLEQQKRDFSVAMKKAYKRRF